MPLKNHKITKLLFLPVIAAVLVLAPAHFAQADGGFSLFSLDSISETFVSKLAYIFFTLIGNGINALVKVLNSVLHMAIYSDSVNAPVVYQSWTIMRDFANMSFIIALIVMAFATIFDIAQYSAKALIGKFLIAALLINFSLTLGGLVIDGAQVLNNTFLTAIGDSALRLGQAVNPVKLLPEGETATTAATSAMAEGTLLFNLVLGLILGGVFLVSILTATLFALIRIPMVWFLLIVSPLAWIAGVFPQGDGYFKNWWKQFVGWNLFLPVFLFFLYFGLYFITNIGNITGAISQGYDKEKIGIAGVTFETLFAYVLAAIFMIGGVITAFKVSFLSGTGAIKAAGWARKATMDRLGFTSMGKAAQMKFQQVQKEGLPGRFGQKLYGGEAGLERRTAKWAERFGVKGMEFQRQKDFVDRANKKYEAVQEEYASGKINADGIKSRAKQFDASDPQGYALYKMLAKLGQLDTESFAKAVTGLKENSYAMRDFVKTAKDSNFSNIGHKTLMSAAMGEEQFKDLGQSFVGAQREIFSHIQSNAKILSDENLFSQQQFTKGLSLFGGALSTEGSAFVKEIGKLRPDIAADYRMSKEEIDKTRERYRKIDPKITDQEIRIKIFGESLTDIKDIASMSREIWNNPNFQKAIENRLEGGTVKAREQFFNNLQTALRTAPDSEEKITILSQYAPRENESEKNASAKKQSPAGIILPPGAQFEQENPEKVNVVDLRNK